MDGLIGTACLSGPDFFTGKKFENFLTEKEEKTNLLRIYKYGLKFGPLKSNGVPQTKRKQYRTEMPWIGMERERKVERRNGFGHTGTLFR